MGTHPIFESDFDCLTDNMGRDRGPRRNKSLFVRNIADDIDQDELHREFSRYGSIKDVYVPRDYYNKRPRGFAYVQFADIHDAEDAQEGMDGRKVCGRFIDVQFAKGDRKSPGSMRIRDPRGGSSRDRRRSRSRSRDRRRRRHSRSDSRESRRRRRRTRSLSKSRRETQRRSRSNSRRREKSRERRRSRSRSRGRRSERRSSRPKSRSKTRSKSHLRSKSPEEEKSKRSHSRSSSKTAIYHERRDAQLTFPRSLC